ncbi:HAD-IA family hydrolase [Verrucomicrobiales bacterium]|jgi:putative hydrolase of the HAD superfamily|nr:HAD-IA family hydrolase [Verrucomicrobiales bacterium]MDB4358652.1 HAD-IA family hydrolase [Verrucomicrobiales bacterium]
MPLNALIFDFDGLILDTEVPIYEAWVSNYRAHGKELPIEIYSGCVGSDFNGFDPKAHLESLLGSRVDWDRWDPLREREAHERTAAMNPLPGIIPILKEAMEQGMPCVVASSSPRSWVEGHLSRLELMSYFFATRCLDDVKAPKPSPELFLAAAAAVNESPESCLVLEDSLNGLNAAIAAGTPCLAVPNQITEHLDFTGAVSQLKSLESVNLGQLREIHTEVS